MMIISLFPPRNFIGAQWRGFTDLGSGLAKFSWRAGTTQGGNDVIAEADVGMTFSAFSSSLSADLPVGQRIYVTVKAFDAAGLLLFNQYKLIIRKIKN